MALSKSLFILSTFISLLTNFLNLSLFTSIPLTILLSFLPISALFKSNFALESDWRLRFFNSRFNASRFSSKVRIEFEITVIRDSKLADLISWEILVIRVDFSEMSSWRFVRSWERVRFEASSDSVWEMDCWRDFYFFVISLFSIFFDCDWTEKSAYDLGLSVLFFLFQESVFRMQICFLILELVVFRCCFALIKLVRKCSPSL